MCSWIAFGTSTVNGQAPIKPVKRYVEGRDTFTVFTIGAERALVYRLQLGRVCAGQVSIQDSALAAYQQAAQWQDSVVATLEEQKKGLHGAVQAQKGQIKGLKTLNQVEEAKARKYKGQRNLAIIGGALLATILAIL